DSQAHTQSIPDEETRANRSLPMADMNSLTPRQREIYTFIRSKIQGRGYGPTVREIGINFQIKSPNGVMCHLKALQKKGLIHREPNMSRAIQLLEDSPTGHPIGVKMVGQIAAVRDDDGEATLKKLYRDKNRFRLEPANRAMKPIFRDHVNVLGVLVGVVRKY